MENNDKKENKRMSPAYVAGYIFGVSVLSCVTAVIVALTIKLLVWMF